jgi:hypothetical protein
VNTSQIDAKLKALRQLVGQRIRNWRASYFDPAVVLDYFERYEPLRDELRSRFPEMLGDLPVRGRPTPSGTTDFDSRGYIVRKELELLLEDLNYSISLLSAADTGEASSAKVTREGVYFAGQKFDALRRVREIFSDATASILLIDTYISEDVLDLLTGKEPGASVRVLTREVPPSLRIAAEAFIQQYGELEIRISRAFHDRFVVIDDRDYFHFGASIKDLGSRGFMFSKIEEPSVVSALSQQIEDAWASATRVVPS